MNKIKMRIKRKIPLIDQHDENFMYGKFEDLFLKL